MKRRLIQGLILVLTFVGGFALATFMARRREPPALAINSPQTITAQAPITFSGGVSHSAFRTHYQSSDGQLLTYGCYEKGSVKAAARYLHDETPEGIVERTITFDGAGNKTGERVVLDSGEIIWTEGSHIHIIRAPSVEYAVLFENARLWADERCWDIAALVQENNSH